MKMAAQRGENLWTRVSNGLACATAFLGRLPRGVATRRRERRLRLRETLSLGEKRFLAVVEFERQEFLVGGTGTSIALLVRLNAEPAPRETSDPAETQSP